MTKLEREAFKGFFPDKAIDLERAARDPAVTDRVAQALRRADLDRDGRLSGDGELHEAFTQLDGFDKNHELGSIRDADRGGPTPLGRVIEALRRSTVPVRAPQCKTVGRETLAAVAKRTGFAPAALQRLNAGLPAGELLEGTTVKLPKRPHHVVRRAQNLERIVALHYRDLDLTGNERERLIDDIVSLNQERYPGMTRHLIDKDWVLTLPAREELVSDLPGDVPLPTRRPDRHAVAYSVRKGDTPLEVIDESYRLTGGARLNAQQRHQILQVTASANRHLRGMPGGLIRTGDTIRLPSADAVRAATGLEVTVVARQARAPDEGVDASPLGHAVGREHRVRPRDNYYRMARDNYVYAGSHEELTPADQDRLVDLTQRLNPSLPARRLRPGTIVSLPSPEAIERELGIDVSLRPPPETDGPPEPDQPVDRRQVIEAFARGTAAVAETSGLPPSVAIAHKILATAWGQRMAPDSNNPYGVAASKDEPGVTQPTTVIVDGKRVRTMARLRKFSSMQEADEDYVRRLQENPAARALLEKVARDGDTRAFVRGLGEVEYSSDPAYAKNMIAVMDRNNLRLYDSPPAARASVVDPGIVAERKQWLQSELTAKKNGVGFYPNEPATSAVGIPFPEWLNIRSFMTANGLASTGGRPTSELAGILGRGYRSGKLPGQKMPQRGETKSRVFIVHDTAGIGQFARLRRFREGSRTGLPINLILGRTPGDYYLNVDFETSRRGTKGNAKRRRAGAGALPSSGFVSVELVAPLKDPFYTDDQYEALARAYIMASYRAGRMLQVVPHREVDRGIPDGHDDPRNFDWKRFYGTVNRMLGLPASTTYGVLPARAGVRNQRDDVTPRYDLQRGFDVYGPIRNKPR